MATFNITLSAEDILLLANKDVIFKPRKDLLEVRESPINGLGVFALRDIPKGTVWWHYDKQAILPISRSQFEALKNISDINKQEEIINIIKHFSYYIEDFDKLILCIDEGRYTNHSNTPNSSSCATSSIAIRDIQAGEEIFEDYRKYDVCPWLELCEEFLQ